MNDSYNRSGLMQLLILFFIVLLCMTLTIGAIWLKGIFNRPQNAQNQETLNFSTSTPIPSPPTTQPTILVANSQERWIVNVLWDNFALYNGIPSDVAEFIPEGETIEPNPPIKKYGICITPAANNPFIGEVYFFNPQTNLFQPEDNTGQTFILATIQEEK